MQAQSSNRPSRESRSRRATVALASGLLGGVLALGAAPALAAEPVDLGGAYVLDDAAVLGGDQARVEAALEALFDELGAPLLVVIVDTFDAPATGADWAEESALRSGLGERDALLAIAVDDRAFGLSPGSEFPVSDDALARAETEALIPALRDDRWADGIVDYADRLRSETSAGGSALPLLLGALALGAVVVVIVLVVRARRGGAATQPPGELSTSDLHAAASRRLVALDDALTTSEHELGFAEAQFGTESTVAFRSALERARTLVTEAFLALQSLDADAMEGASPSDTDRRTALVSIIERCDDADALLAEQEEAFDALRAVEHDLPAAVAAAQAARAEGRATADTARTVALRLHADFHDSAVTAIADAPEQLVELLSLVDSELEAAAAAQQAGDLSQAAIEVRSAQLALAQLDSVAGSVTRLSADLEQARSSLAAQRDDLASGIAATRALIDAPTRPDGDAPALAAALASSEAAIDAIDDRDPVASLERLVGADRALDSELAEARAESERQAAAAAALERTLASARSAILSAAEYIASHRGAVGAGARASLADAKAQLEVAVAARAADAASALGTAQRAHELARESLAAAERDVRGALSPQGSLGAILGQGGTGRGSSGSLVTGLMGGLLAGSGSPRPRFGSSGGSGSSSSRRSTPARSSRGRAPSPARASRPTRTTRSRSSRSRGGRF